jgi:D-alanine-D-alanine ligase
MGGHVRKIRVAVVFGGRSTEHAISCASAGLVLSAIDPDRYEVLPVGITTDGRWVLTSGDPARLALSGGTLPSVESVAVGEGVGGGPAGAGGGGGGGGLAGAGGGGLAGAGGGGVGGDLAGAGGGGVGGDLAGAGGGAVGGDLAGAGGGAVGGDLEIAGQAARGLLGDVDLVLPLLHGAYGEDGTLQGLLEMTGIKYAGAGVLASAAGMDKEYMKLILSARGLPIVRHVVVHDRDWRSGVGERKRLLDEIAELGWPVFVKPARGGSSIGISRVDGPADLEQAIEAARAHDPKVLAEEAMDGMEVECAVLEGLDGGPPEASLPGQVLVDERSEFYDFEAKYLASQTTMRIPAPIPSAAVERIRQLACEAFDAISCEGLARVDFFYTAAGKILVNEINTMPGMTQASAFPMMWAATGLPLPQLIDRILQTALRKRPGLLR